MENTIQGIKSKGLKLFIISTLLLSGVACQNSNDSVDKYVNDEEEEPAMTKAEQDAEEFVEKAAQINLKEIELAKIAIDKSTDSTIKTLAEKIEKDHSTAQEKLKELADSKNYNLLFSLNVKGKEARNKLNDKVKGNEFDKEFCQMMIDGHEKAISKFEDAWEELEDQDLKDWINNTLPILKDHLNEAQNCQNTLVKK